MPHLDYNDWGIQDDKFFLNYYPLNRPVKNLREESENLAKQLYNQNNKIIISLSSGMDSQVVIHSFYSQGFAVDAAFLYIPGSNDDELVRIKELEKKYKFNVKVVEIDTVKIKDRIIEESIESQIHPYQIVHKLFLEQLPSDYDFIQGSHGPNFISQNKKIYLVETYNSIEKSFSRAFSLLNRQGKYIEWTQYNSILYSILEDQVVNDFLKSFRYFENSNFLGKKLKAIDYWDYYLKPQIYSKYWKDELIYVSNKVSCQHVDYLIDYPKHNYRKNLILIDFESFINLTKTSNAVIHYSE
jgi:diphthamide synthase (EF-2-diphthine--ammonia ligase)